MPRLLAVMVVLAIGVVGAVVRPGWGDEYFTLDMAARPVAEILRALRLDSGPPGYYLIGRLIWILGGHSLLVFRLVSVAGATLTVWLVTSFASRFGVRAACSAAALAATHPMLLVAASDARAYAIIAAAAAAAMMLICGSLDGWRTVMLGSVLVAACWIHSLGLLLVGGCLVAAVLRRPLERRRIWLACLVALVAYLPWIPTMSVQPVQALSWMADALSRAPGWKGWLIPIVQSAPSVSLGPWLDGAAVHPLVEGGGAIAWLALLLVGLRATPRLLPAALAWAAIAATALGVTYLIRPIYFPGRIDTLWLAAGLTIAAAGAGRWRPGIWLAVVLSIMGTTTSIRSIVDWSRAELGPDRRVATALDRLAAPGDTIVVTGWWRLPVPYSMGDRRKDFNWLSFPLGASDHPGWYDESEVDRGDVDALLAAVQGLPSGTLWLVRTPALQSDRFLDPFAARMRLTPRVLVPPLAAVWGPSADARSSPHVDLDQSGRQEHPTVDHLVSSE